MILFVMGVCLEIDRYWNRLLVFFIEGWESVLLRVGSIGGDDNTGWRGL